MLGKVLREARKAKNLTLKELAEIAGISAGYISHLENDRMQPSITVLSKLMKFLDIPANVALDTEPKKTSYIVVRRKERAEVRFSNINGLAEILTPFQWKGNINPQIKAIKLHLPPLESLTKEAISIDHDEWIYVAEGCLEYRKGDDIELLYAGDSIYIPKLTGHSIRNPENIPAIIYWLTRGGNG